jgi:hypothetical protein
MSAGMLHDIADIRLISANNQLQAGLDGQRKIHGWTR